MRMAVVGFGLALVLVGGLWTLQGIGLVGGSAMSGQSLWAIVGGLAFIGGAGVCALGLRGGAPRPNP